MFRFMFNQPRRKDEGELLEANQAIQTYIAQPNKANPSKTNTPGKLHRLEIWSMGFIDALDELEQSQYCCNHFSQRVNKAFIDEMDTDELDDYHRFVYFYKNAIIRLFSTLDKLGYFLNDLFELESEKVKPHFSYFTVLRRMHERHIHESLEQELYELKTKYKVTMDLLRDQRNMEIHYINAEMADDLLQTPSVLDRIHVENIQDNVANLERGFEVVCRTFSIAFTYINGLMVKR